MSEWVNEWMIEWRNSNYEEFKRKKSVIVQILYELKQKKWMEGVVKLKGWVRD